MLNNLSEINELVSRGARFYVSHSGGKDSQAMYALLRQVVPYDQITVIHADLGAIEWEGVQTHINKTTYHFVNVVSANKSFFDMVRNRHIKRPDAPCWPSPSVRQCTSDLKRDPIHKFIRNDLRTRGESLAVNCTGIRAEESSGRAKQKTFELNKRLSKAGREVYELKPIHAMTTDQVFEAIREAGQKPFWAYQAGNQRLSCVFCIMGCGGDLKHGAKQRPELYEQYVQLERETGWTMFHGQSLEDKVGVKVKFTNREAA